MVTYLYKSIVVKYNNHTLIKIIASYTFCSGLQDTQDEYVEFHRQSIPNLDLVLFYASLLLKYFKIKV